MADYANLYKTDAATNQKGRIEQLLQLLRVTWDGDLVNKVERDILLKTGMAQRVGEGFNLITPKGIKTLFELGLIHP
jgi:hypothetical protein